MHRKRRTARESFSGGDESHSMWVDVSGAAPRLMMASVTKPLSQHLVDFAKKAKLLKPDKKKNETLKAIAAVTPHVATIESKSASAGPKSRLAVEKKTVLDQNSLNYLGKVRARLWY